MIPVRLANVKVVSELGPEVSWGHYKENKQPIEGENAYLALCSRMFKSSDSMGRLKLLSQVSDCVVSL